MSATPRRGGEGERKKGKRNGEGRRVPRHTGGPGFPCHRRLVAAVRGSAATRCAPSPPPPHARGRVAPRCSPGRGPPPEGEEVRNLLAAGSFPPVSAYSVCNDAIDMCLSCACAELALPTWSFPLARGGSCLTSTQVSLLSRGDICEKKQVKQGRAGRLDGR